MRSRTAVGQWVEEERERQDLTQMQLASKAGLHLQTIFGIESGKTRKPGLETMQKIVAALGRTMDDLPEPEPSSQT